jgi:hypothetical protein
MHLARFRVQPSSQRTTDKARSLRLHGDRFHRVVRISLLLALSQTANQPSLPPELSLAEALSIALLNNITLRTAQSNFERASGQLLQRRSALLPRVEMLTRRAYLVDACACLRQDLLNIAVLRAQQSCRWAKDSSRSLVNNARPDAIELQVRFLPGSAIDV